MKEKIMPALILTIVCAVVCGLLAVVNALTRDKIVQAEADKVQRSLVSVFGEGSYAPLDMHYDGVAQVYAGKGLTIYDITVDGYSKNGIRALVGIDENGAVAAVGIVSCGETAGVGTKITAPDYLAKFAGVSDESGYPDMISGATFSSKGIRAAVTLALACSRSQQQPEKMPDNSGGGVQNG
ncbi:MAG: FMN-binding protein [Oscillospiraceae bacterium]|nr:FMN-binding protein [Oscillospiraceae bacterium]